MIFPLERIVDKERIQPHRQQLSNWCRRSEWRERKKKKEKKRKKERKKYLHISSFTCNFIRKGKYFLQYSSVVVCFPFILINRREHALSGSVNILCSPRYMYFDRSSRISDRVSRIFLPNQIRRDFINIFILSRYALKSNGLRYFNLKDQSHAILIARTLRYSISV